MAKAQPIMLQGTASDVGKSVLAAAFCRIFAQQGYKTAPFKAQNMALNSYVTWDGKEIGRAQGLQAEAAGIPASADMNPILLKPARDHEAQVIVQGTSRGNRSAGGYRRDFFHEAFAAIRESYGRLAASYERIVIEGAGSPAEINLQDRELANMRIARMANAPVILIGDIDKGGVFASLVGTLQLLAPEDRKRVIGVIINKFRGDFSLLKPGLDWFANYTGKPVLGVIPYLNSPLFDAEDSLALASWRMAREQTDVQSAAKPLDVAVIAYPRMANFTDAEPFLAEPDCRVRLVREAAELGVPDMVILPGTKNTIEDLQYVKTKRLAAAIVALAQNSSTLIVGICGGYQMLGRLIRDPYGVESPCAEEQGIGLLPVETELAKEKTVARIKATAIWRGEAHAVAGYEIHMGKTKRLSQAEDLLRDTGGDPGIRSSTSNVIGTYMHDFFHNDSLRCRILNDLRANKGLPAANCVAFTALRQSRLDQLANCVRQNVDLAYIEQAMAQFSE
ncbi:MAG TPA: cobyric acid synthase [Bacilli bacterium]